MPSTSKKFEVEVCLDSCVVKVRSEGLVCAVRCLFVYLKLIIFPHFLFYTSLIELNRRHGLANSQMIHL
jgi:hypothetical protein